MKEERVWIWSADWKTVFPISQVRAFVIDVESDGTAKLFAILKHNYERKTLIGTFKSHNHAKNHVSQIILEGEKIGDHDVDMTRLP